jgi:hypothetical protein
MQGPVPVPAQAGITPTHPTQKIYWLLKNNGDGKYDPGLRARSLARALLFLLLRGLICIDYARDLIKKTLKGT